MKKSKKRFSEKMIKELREDLKKRAENEGRVLLR